MKVFTKMINKIKSNVSEKTWDRIIYATIGIVLLSIHIPCAYFCSQI